MDSKTLIRILIIAAVVVIFFTVTIINLKTKKPEGCEKDKDENACLGCTLSCNKKDTDKNQ